MCWCDATCTQCSHAPNLSPPAAHTHTAVHLNSDTIDNPIDACSVSICMSCAVCCLPVTVTYEYANISLYYILRHIYKHTYIGRDRLSMAAKRYT